MILMLDNYWFYYFRVIDAYHKLYPISHQYNIGMIDKMGKFYILKSRYTTSIKCI